MTSSSVQTCILQPSDRPCRPSQKYSAYVLTCCVCMPDNDKFAWCQLTILPSNQNHSHVYIHVVPNNSFIISCVLGGVLVGVCAMGVLAALCSSSPLLAACSRPAFQNYDSSTAFCTQWSLRLLSLHITACCSWMYNSSFTHLLAEALATCKIYALQHLGHESLWRTDLTLPCQ